MIKIRLFLQRALSSGSLGRKSLQTVITNGLCLFMAFASNILLTRGLGAAQMGIYVALFTYPAMVSTFFQLGIRQSTACMVGQKTNSDLEIINSIFSIFCVACPSAVIACVFLYNIAPGDPFSAILIFLGLLTVPIGLVRSYATGIFLGKDQIGTTNLLQILQPSTFLVILTVSIYWGMPLEAFVLASIISGLPSVIFIFSKLNLRGRVSFSRDLRLIRKMLTLGSVFALALFLNTLIYRIDVVMLQALATSSEVGQYALAVKIGETLWQIPAAVGLVIFAKSANSWDGRSVVKVRRAMRIIFWGTIGVCIGILCLLITYADRFIPFVYSSEFKDSATMLQLLAPGILALSVYKILGSELAGRGKPWTAIICALPALLINISLNFFMIPFYGGNGAAMATTCSYVLMGISYMVVYIKIK